MDEKIIIRRIADGWQVLRIKPAGVGKGEQLLATLCGGNLGKVLAATCAQEAALLGMIDTIEIEEG